MSYSASLIAYAFVKKAIESGNPVTQMKLQKLVYFAHGLHLASYDEPLISEYFQAWKYGPVVPAIYQEYKYYGSSPIATTDLLSISYNVSDVEDELTTIDVNATQSINTTWNALKLMSATQLSNWTHKESSPWAINYEEGVNEKIIPDTEIKQYFKTHIVKE
jgi:uncharacterized phage-associated protein